ncbi:MAG: hypothetical protein HQL73_02145 [Magnetococcales bacterium]|nr:hypothetical protein [Magnetococcales bacterium]
MTRKLAMGLILVVVLDTLGQLLWKWTAARLPEWQSGWQMTSAILEQPWFLVVAAVFLFQLFNWLKVLEGADLSFALPITSLSYVTVAFFSNRMFDEPIGASKIVGIACVLAGVGWIGMGKPQGQPSVTD